MKQNIMDAFLEKKNITLFNNSTAREYRKYSFDQPTASIHFTYTYINIHTVF